MTTIALLGAGGKMGVRLSKNLRGSRFDVRHVEVGEAGRQRLKDEVGVDCVEQAAALAGADVVIGLGGGSSLDIAKAAAALSANPGPVSDYFGMDRVPQPGLPLMLVPTTAGTGSEMTSICVLSDTKNSIKTAIVSDRLFAKTVLLDPELTLGLPPMVTATTGMDALVHAIESYTGVRATPLTDLLNHEAIRLIAGNLRQAYANGGNLAARENMLHASALAGMAFSNTQNGLIHALALAIGGRYPLPHGLLTAFICPWALEYNLIANPAKYAEIARLFGEDTAGLPPVNAARQYRLSVPPVRVAPQRRRVRAVRTGRRAAPAADRPSAGPRRQGCRGPALHPASNRRRPGRPASRRPSAAPRARRAAGGWPGSTGWCPATRPAAPG